MIRAFGKFVAGDQVIVGVILFSILVVIQFVVITQGATRISEVAARFTLDGLPGRQMAIDADLHAGLIDQHEAHRRRDEVYRQADFFGAMDGASRFVRGDAIAGVVILLVNIGGGLLLGMINHGMSLGEAVERLHEADDRRRPGQPGARVLDLAGRGADRDPLVVVDRPEPRRRRPAVLAARRAGHRRGVPGIDGTDAAAQAAAADPGRCARRRRDSRRRAPRRERRTTSGRPARRTARLVESASSRAEERAAIGLGLEARAGQSATLATAAKSRSDDTAPERMEDLLHVDPLELEIGFRLIGLADPTRGGDLLDRLKTVRQRVAREMGLIVPQVRIHDRDRPAAQRIPRQDPRDGGGAGDRLCRPAAGGAAGRAGHAARRPRRRRPGHRPAGRLDPRRRPRGRRAGRLPRARSLGGRRRPFRRDRRQPCRRALDPRAGRAAARSGPLDGADAGRTRSCPGCSCAGELQRVLQNLLRERVSIRDLETILETLAVHAGKTKDIDLLTEQVRQSLARQITENVRGAGRPAAGRHAWLAAGSTGSPRPARPRPAPPRPWAKIRPRASSAPSPWRSARWSRAAIRP